MYVEMYLTLNARQTARAGLRLTEASAVTSTGLSRESQGMKLPLLLPVDELDPCCLKDGLALFRGEWLKETSVLLLAITDVAVSVFIWDLICSKPVCFLLVNGPTGNQLE